MKTCGAQRISLRITKSIYSDLKEIAEKIAALNVLRYLEKRAARGSREKLLAVLAKAPDTEPEGCDRL